MITLFIWLGVLIAGLVLLYAAIGVAAYVTVKRNAARRWTLETLPESAPSPTDGPDGTALIRFVESAGLRSLGSFVQTGQDSRGESVSRASLAAWQVPECPRFVECVRLTDGSVHATITTYFGAAADTTLTTTNLKLGPFLPDLDEDRALWLPGAPIEELWASHLDVEGDLLATDLALAPSFDYQELSATAQARRARLVTSLSLSRMMRFWFGERIRRLSQRRPPQES